MVGARHKPHCDGKGKLEGQPVQRDQEAQPQHHTLHPPEGNAPS